jgi:peptide/nickel transport system substrate-binding protein
MRKPANIVVLFFLVFVIALTGCGPKNTGGGTEPPQATPVAETSVPAPTTIPPNAIDRTIRLDPATASDNDSLTISTYIYDCLTRLDVNGQPQPGLALQWTPSDDQLDYVVILRHGVKFQNGADFNADVVLANFNRWFDPKDALHGTGTYTGWKNNFLGFQGEVDANGIPISFYDGIEKVDTYTVLIHLNRAEPNLFSILANPYFAMLNPKLLTVAGDAYSTSADTTSGTGAYEILSWTDTGLVLSPSPIFWGDKPTANLQFGWK